MIQNQKQALPSAKIVSKRDHTFDLKLNAGIVELRCICEPRAILILIQIRKQALSSSKIVCKRNPAFDFKLNSSIAEYVIRVNQLRS